MGFRAVLFALCVSQALGEKVVTLTTSNFDDFVKENGGGTLVKFYAPWCGHCKAIAPEFEKAAEQLEAKNIKLGKVDATVESSLGQRFGVSGYPTLKWFVDGQPSEYDGGRTADTIVQWISSMTGPAVDKIENLEEAGEISAGKPRVVYYGAAAENEGFSAAAKTLRKKAQFFSIVADKVKLTLEHAGEPAIEKEFGAADEVTAEVVKKLIEENNLPLFGILDGDTFSSYMEASVGLVWSLFKIETSDDLTKVAADNRGMMTEVANKFKGKYAVTYTDTIKFKDAIKGMLDVTEFPRIAVQKKAGDKKKFIYDGEMTAEKIIDYVQQVEDGKIEAVMKSEEIPAEDQSKQNVWTVVGKTLEEVVFNKEKDVLFEVYAPWCGHCKKLEPEFEKVGKKVQKEELTDILTIAKMDGTLNDSPRDEISWSGFPTMVFVKKGGAPAPFNGDRTAKGMWKWIKDNASDPDAIKDRVAKNKEEREKAAAGGGDAAEKEEL